MPRIDGRELYIIGVEDALIEVIIDFALTRKEVEKYKENKNYTTMSKRAHEKFGTLKTIREKWVNCFFEEGKHDNGLFSELKIKKSTDDSIDIIGNSNYPSDNGKVVL